MDGKNDGDESGEKEKVVGDTQGDAKASESSGGGNTPGEDGNIQNEAAGDLGNEKEARGIANKFKRGERGRPAEADAIGGASTPDDEGEEGGEDENKKRGSYPSPAAMAGEDAVVLLEPTFGRHRPDKNAILAFAEGYDIKIYLLFLETLRSARYRGDIVLAVSSISKLKAGVEEYLRSFAEGGINADVGGMNVVVYTVDWTCYKDGKVASGPKEGMRRCKLNGAYGIPNPNESDERPAVAEDPRDARPVATARYELYWAWSLRYNPSRWIALVDSRDTYFQSDPFEALEGGRERKKVGGDDTAPAATSEEDDYGSEGGELHLFEENADSAKLGESTFNRNWLTTAYGLGVVSSFLDKPIVCSGSTLGRQVAVESYLRAMVAQFDETGCMSKGCDQGFHNYLHYSGSLESLGGIKRVIVNQQGRGIINNLGLLREKPLREQGVLETSEETRNVGGMRVLNWDGSPSSVVHQFDRDKELNKVMNLRRKELILDWKKVKQLKGEQKIQ